MEMKRSESHDENVTMAVFPMFFVWIRVFRKSKVTLTKKKRSEISKFQFMTQSRGGFVVVGILG